MHTASRLLLALAILGGASTKAITSPQPDPTVYITKTGKKYHQDGCRTLRKSKIAIKLSDAQAKGYGACQICH